MEISAWGKSYLFVNIWNLSTAFCKLKTDYYLLYTNESFYFDIGNMLSHP